MVNENAINWNGALVYALALFLPDGEWPPLPPDPIPESTPAPTRATAARTQSSTPTAVPPRNGGCGVRLASGAEDTPSSLVGLALAFFWARRRSRR